MQRLATPLIALILTTACGGAGTGSDPRGQQDGQDGLNENLTAEDMIPRAELSRAELTTEVDAKRYRSEAPPATEFTPTEKTIYFVGRLKKVPTDSTIEVRWFVDASPTPLLTSHITGSDKYEFIASFQPTDRKFDRGTYTARVYVNDTEVGAVPFLIEDRSIAGMPPKVSDIKLSKKITKKNHPQREASKFSKEISRIYASFRVAGAERGETIDVQWKRGHEDFYTESIVLDTDRRYSSYIEANPALPGGSYEIQVRLRNTLVAQKTFLVGEETNGSVIDTFALGEKLDQNNMPVQPTTTFKKGTPLIQCGVRFLDLPPETVIEIQWIELNGTEEYVLYTNRSMLQGGGSGTMGAAWEPKSSLVPGTYKASVVIGEEVVAEELFAVK